MDYAPFAVVVEREGWRRTDPIYVGFPAPPYRIDFKDLNMFEICAALVRSRASATGLRTVRRPWRRVGLELYAPVRATRDARQPPRS